MTVLLQKKLDFTEKDNKTNRVLPFQVPPRTEKLTVHFSYAPKVLDDTASAKAQIAACLQKDGPPDTAYSDAEIESYLPIVNLLCISLDAPSGYRGGAHRHDPIQHHVFTAEEAPDGFYAGKLEAGQWDLQIHLHAVVSEHCTAEIRIEAEGEQL